MLCCSPINTTLMTPQYSSSSLFLLFLLLLLLSPINAIPKKKRLRNSPSRRTPNSPHNSLHAPLSPPPPSPPSPPLPIVYIWFDSWIPQYQWDVIEVALHHNNTVFFVTAAPEPVTPPPSFSPPSGSSHLLKIVSLSSLESPALHAFRSSHYLPFGLWEPYEQQNMERFFLLHQLLTLHSIPLVLFMDSDAAFLSHATSSLLPSPSCSALIVPDPHPSSFYSSHRWVIWTGTSILSLPLLTSFLSFAPQLYHPPYLPILQEKNSLKPYVCDMSIWYLFALCSDPTFQTSQKPPSPLPLLPSCAPSSFCFTDQFDHQRGHTEGGFQLDPKQKIAVTEGGVPKLSIHFQVGDYLYLIFLSISNEFFLDLSFPLPPLTVFFLFLFFFGTGEDEMGDWLCVVSGKKHDG